MGLELIHICINPQFDTLSDFNGLPAYTRKNNFTREARKSTLFTYRNGDKIMKILKKKEVSVLMHSFAVSPKTYEKYPVLADNFKIISTMLDHDGNEFIAMAEHKEYPIFVIQFHPEKNSFEFFRSIYPHDDDAIFAETYLSNLFVSLGRKNNHTFPLDELSQNLIYNWPPVFTNSVYETVSIID